MDEVKKNVKVKKKPSGKDPEENEAIKKVVIKSLLSIASADASKYMRQDVNVEESSDGVAIQEFAIEDKKLKIKFCDKMEALKRLDRYISQGEEKTGKNSGTMIFLEHSVPRPKKKV